MDITSTNYSTINKTILAVLPVVSSFIIQDQSDTFVFLVPLQKAPRTLPCDLVDTRGYEFAIGNFHTALKFGKGHDGSPTEAFAKFQNGIVILAPNCSISTFAEIWWQIPKGFLKQHPGECFIKDIWRNKFWLITSQIYWLDHNQVMLLSR